MLVQALLVMLAAWLAHVLWYIFSLLREDPGPGLTLVVIMGGQGDAAEGFLRRLMRVCGESRPDLGVVVFKDGPRDDTAGVVRLLGRKYPGLRMECNKGVDPCPPIPGLWEYEGRPAWCYDARGEAGRALLNSPLFTLLSPS